MSGVRDFIEDQSRYEIRLSSEMGWSFIEGQGKGSAIDYVAPDGTKIEAKFDWDSVKTGNHYLEYAQTSDSGSTWSPSGFSLSSGEADIWVVINEEWMRVIKIESLVKMLAQNRSAFPIAKTQSGVNQNRRGQYSKGYLVPLDILDKIVLIKLRSPIIRV